MVKVFIKSKNVSICNQFPQIDTFFGFYKTLGVNVSAPGVFPESLTTFGDSTEGHVNPCLSARCSSQPMMWSQKGIDALIMVRMMCYNGIDILDSRRKELVNARKKLRNDRLIKLDRRKLKKYRTQNSKYHEALQVKVSTDNPRLQVLIHNI